MARVTEGQPFYKIPEPPKEEANTPRSPVGKIGMDRIKYSDPGGGSTEYFIENMTPGMEAYTRRVIEALERKDSARERNELARSKSTAPSCRSSTRLP